MGAADGTVLGLTKVVDAGLPGDKWNIVLVAEGFTAAEVVSFQGFVDDFVAEFYAQPPFNEDAVACAINLYRLEVSSTESGADFPDCDGDGTAATTAATYFDASYCTMFDGAPLLRLLAGDGTLVGDTLDDYLPEWDQALVIVNDTRYGGAGGGIAWTSVNAGWLDVAIHELGHSIFDLADEYESDGDDTFADPEPPKPNVTTITDRDDPAFKWADLFSPDLANEVTMPNPDCTATNSGASPVAADRVGLFEGAMYHHCAIYRSQYDCRMRSNGSQFCAVCQRIIRDFYAFWAGPAPTGGVTLPIPDVQFVDVPVNTTAVRAATFEVDSCTAVTFNVTTSPAAPFTIESSLVVVAQPSGVLPWKAYVWFRYECGPSVDAHTDHAIIRCVETGEDFMVDLTGNCVPRPRVAAQLVLDQSGSMNDMTDEGRRKIEVLTEAATVFVEHLYDDNGIGVNAFHADPVPILDVQDAGAPGAGGGRDDARDALAVYAHVPGALTAIGDGIELARTKLDDARAAAAGTPNPFDRTAMVVLTDGKETADQRVDDVADRIVADDVFAIGLGTGEQIEPGPLIALTNATGNYTLMTGNVSTDDTFLLDKYYLQILAGLNNNDIIMDPEGWLGREKRVMIPFDVTEADIEITPTVLSVFSDAIEVALLTPDDKLIDPTVAAANPSIEFIQRQRVTYYRPMLPFEIEGTKAHAGRWHIVLKLDDKGFRKYLSSLDGQPDATDRALAHGLRYSANAYVYSNLRLRGSVTQDSYEPGASLVVRASLTEYGAPFTGRASAFAELQHPDGSQAILPMADVGGGVYTAELVAADVGVYTFRIRVSGATSRELQFTREQTATAPVWRGGDNPPSRDGTGVHTSLCLLIQCLARAGLSTKRRERLAEWGLDLDALAKCFCHSKVERPKD
jgi:hypothetical protein